jgi:hypothetical protein
MRAVGFMAMAGIAAWLPAPAPARAGPNPRVGQIRTCGGVVRPGVSPRVAHDGRLIVTPPEIVVEPLSFGPRISDDPRDDGPLTTEGFRALLPTDDLRACYRWARGTAPSLAATLSAVVRIDDWGDVESADVETEAPGARPVTACIKEVLAGMYLQNVGRPTEIRMRIKLVRTGLGRPHETRPKARAPLGPPPGLCPAAQAPPAVLDLGDPIVIDDFDQWQSGDEEDFRDCQSKHSEALACRRDGHSRSCGSTAPCHFRRSESALGGSSRMFPDVYPNLPQRLLANLGAYRACYAEANTPPQDLDDTRHIEVWFDRRGFVAAVTPRGKTRALHDRLEDCLEAALRNVWIEAVRPMQAEVTIVLRQLPARRAPAAILDSPGTPETTEQIQARARAALDAGDGESARELYERLAAKLPGDPRTCDWLASALHATEIVEPWLGDRSMAAFGALAARTRAAPAAPETTACLTRAREDLLRLAHEPHKSAVRMGVRRLYAVAAARYRRLLDELPTPPIPELQHDYAEALWYQERWCEAAAQYDQVATTKVSEYDLGDAREGAMVSWEDCLDETDQRDGDATESIGRRLKAAIDRYLAGLPVTPTNH